MRLIVTIGEIVDRELWEDFCDVTGTKIYARAEGLLIREDEVVLTEEQAKNIGFLRPGSSL